MVFQNLACNVAVYDNYSLLSFGAMEVRILLENLGFGSVRNWTASLLSPDLRVCSVLEFGGMERVGSVPRTNSCVRLERRNGTN
jgi:hypothetical protein